MLCGNDRRRLAGSLIIVKLCEVFVDFPATYPEFVAPFVARDNPEIYLLSCHN